MPVLPYRIQNYLDQRRLLKAIRGIHRLPSIPIVTDVENATWEVWLQLCRRDLIPGLLAIYSLHKALNVDDPKPLVSVILDDIVNQDEIALIQRFYPHIRLLKRFDPPSDFKDNIHSYPELLTLWKSPYPCSPKLLYPIMYSRTPRVMVMDPDTVFWRHPKVIIDWINQTKDTCLYLYDVRPGSDLHTMSAEGIEKRNAFFIERYGHWKIDHPFYNSGLIGFNPVRMKLSQADEYMNWVNDLDPKYKQGQGAIWFGDWTPEQSCYLAMLALSEASVEPFGEDYCLGFAPQKVFNHFLRAGLIQTDTQAHLKKLIAGWAENAIG